MGHPQSLDSLVNPWPDRCEDAHLPAAELGMVPGSAHPSAQHAQGPPCPSVPLVDALLMQMLVFPWPLLLARVLTITLLQRICLVKNWAWRMAACPSAWLLVLLMLCGCGHGK